jgi:3-dehydroquinate dehydratase
VKYAIEGNQLVAKAQTVEDNLIIARMMQNNTKVVSCPVCGISMGSRAALSMHIKHKHPKKVGEPVI